MKINVGQYVGLTDTGFVIDNTICYLLSLKAIVRYVEDVIQ